MIYIFQEVENKIQLTRCPFSFDNKMAPDNLQLELMDLQHDNRLNKIFSSVMYIYLYGTFVTSNTAVSKIVERTC